MSKSMEKIKNKGEEEVEEKKEIEEMKEEAPKEEVGEEKMSEEDIAKQEAEIEAQDEEELAKTREEIKEMPEEGKREGEEKEEKITLSKKFVEEYEKARMDIKESDIPRKVKEGESLTTKEREKWEHFRTLFRKKKEAEKWIEGVTGQVEKLKNIAEQAESKRKENLQDLMENYKEVIKKIKEAGIPEKLAKGEKLTLNEKLLLKNFQNIEATRKFLMGEPIEPTKKEAEKEEKISETKEEIKTKEEEEAIKPEEEEGKKEVSETKREKEEDFYLKLEKTIKEYDELKAKLEESNRPKGFLGGLRGRKEKARIREEWWQKKNELEKMKREFMERESRKDYLLKQAEEIVKKRYKEAGIKEPSMILEKEDILRTAQGIAEEVWEKKIK